MIQKRELTLKKTGTDTYTNDACVSNGNPTITDPVWKVLDLDNTPDVNPPDPVFFVTGAVMKVAGGGATKLDLKPNFGTASMAVKLKVDATALYPWDLTFGPTNITLTGANVATPALSETSGHSVAIDVENYTYDMAWKMSLDNGLTWNTFQTMTQVVFTVYDTPMTDYCSNVSGAFPYTWSALSRTAKRMDWATSTNAAYGASDEYDPPSTVSRNVSENPGFEGWFTNNPFVHLETPDPGGTSICHRADCITLANLAATALRLVGENARPCRAYTVNSIDQTNSATWGWIPRNIHPYHGEWWLGYWGNNFEGFFYIGDANPPASSNWPSTGWTVAPLHDITMPAGKEEYLPIGVLASNVPVSQLQWQTGNNPDVEWTNNPIGGVAVKIMTPDADAAHCTNWLVGAEEQYQIAWATNNSTLTLHTGSPVSVTTNGTYYPSCSNGNIKVSVTLPLPGNSQTGTVSIVPARTLAPIP